MPHGGTREGAGRKARPTKKTREQRNTEFDEKASAALPELFETITTIAKGYQVAVYERPRKVKSQEMQDDTGTVMYVYSIPPDRAAVMYLIDRAAGRASVKQQEQSDTTLILEVGGFNDDTTEPGSDGPDEEVLPSV